MRSLVLTVAAMAAVCIATTLNAGDEAWEGVPIPTTTQIPSGSLSPTTSPNEYPLHTSGVLTSGVTISERQCRALPRALWLTVDRNRFCVRYWLSTSSVAKDEATVFLHGDIGGLLDGKVQLYPAARRVTPTSVQQDAERASRVYGGPFVVIGRLGAFGSSGHHVRDRLTRLEPRVVDAALNALKERYGFKRFHVSGESGGGHTAAALAQIRDDLGCVVISSGAVSIRSWYRDAGQPVTAKVASLYNPIEHVRTMRHRPGVRLVLLSDPDDKAVSFRSQREFVDRVMAKSLPILHITAAAMDKLSHDLRGQALRLTADCAKGMDDQALVAKYQTKPAPAQEAGRSKSRSN